MKKKERQEEVRWETQESGGLSEMEEQYLKNKNKKTSAA